MRARSSPVPAAGRLPLALRRNELHVAPQEVFMRRTLFMTLLALAIGAASAGAQTDIGVGAFGGMSIPIANDLSKQGPQFGVRIPARIAPWLAIEGFWAMSELGDAEEDFGGPTTFTRDGGEVNAFGVNALFPFGGDEFGEGIRFFPFVGLGSYSLAREGSDDVDDMGLNFGLGLGFFVMPKLTLDLRGEFAAIITDETSQKFGNVTLGATWYLF
jgi:hypothetical protein